MFWQKVKEAWKAVVAFAVPLLLGVLASTLEFLGEWITTQGFVWAGIATGVLTSVSVWLKANATS